MQHDSLNYLNVQILLNSIQSFGELPSIVPTSKPPTVRFMWRLPKGEWDENDASFTHPNQFFDQISNDIAEYCYRDPNDGKNHLQSYLDDIFGLINSEEKRSHSSLHQSTSQQSENVARSN